MGIQIHELVDDTYRLFFNIKLPEPEVVEEEVVVKKRKRHEGKGEEDEDELEGDEEDEDENEDELEESEEDEDEPEEGEEDEDEQEEGEVDDNGLEEGEKAEDELREGTEMLEEEPLEEAEVGDGDTELDEMPAVVKTEEHIDSEGEVTSENLLETPSAPVTLRPASATDQPSAEVSEHGSEGIECGGEMVSDFDGEINRKVGTVWSRNHKQHEHTILGSLNLLLLWMNSPFVWDVILYIMDVMPNVDTMF